MWFSRRIPTKSSPITLNTNSFSQATRSHAAAQAIFEEAKKLPAQRAAPSRAHCAALLANERKKLEFLCDFWFELQELSIVKELTDAAH
jgi:hypothetical protein